MSFLVYCVGLGIGFVLGFLVAVGMAQMAIRQGRLVIQREASDD